MDKSPSRISFDTMARLMYKPAHKPIRTKYDSFKQECLNDKRNTTQTAEDEIHRDTVHWTTSLRPLDPTNGVSKQSLKSGKKTNANYATESNDRHTTRPDLLAVPPGFYDEDMQKWDNKFKTARENRQ